MVSTKNFQQELFSYWLLLPTCLLQANFYWLHEMAACCYFGADLGKGLDHNFPSLLTDGTPRSSSDLLSSSLVFHFTSPSPVLLLPIPLLLKLESKQCPLTLASVLACADSADEIRFRSKSES